MQFNIEDKVDMPRVYNPRIMNNKTHLVNVEVFNDRVKARVEIVEQIDDLEGCALGRETRKADYVAKINRHLIVRLGDYASAQDQLRRHRSANRQRRERTMSYKVYRIRLLCSQSASLSRYISWNFPEAYISFVSNVSRADDGAIKRLIESGLENYLTRDVS